MSAADYPQAFLERMQTLLGDEYPAFSSGLYLPATNGLRANTLKLSPQLWAELAPFPLERVPWCPTGFQLPPAGGVAGDIYPGKHPYHAAGLYYLQEPSAMAAVEILDPQPGERVLDLAAAPGGKATQIVSKMENTGLLVANDIHPQRVWELAENLERWGARCAVILNETPSRLGDHFQGYFDRVLLDAPCSGEGMFRKSAHALLDWSPELVRSSAVRQAAILEQAARMVCPGGTLVYSTCTFAPEENEAVIARFLQDNADFEIAAAERYPGFLAGRPDWAGQVQSAIAEQIEKSTRLWPHHLQGEGHFIARLDHKGEKTGARKTHQQSRLPAAYQVAFDEFCRTVLTEGLDTGSIQLQGTYLYQQPDGMPDLSGLRIIHPGFWLGVFKRGSHTDKARFEPSHALALAINPGLVKHTCPLTLEQAAGYLKGEVMPSAGEEGWVLVTLSGFALGWGKRSRGLVKNYYPKGLRWV